MWINHAPLKWTDALKWCTMKICRNTYKKEINYCSQPIYHKQHHNALWTSNTISYFTIIITEKRTKMLGWNMESSYGRLSQTESHTHTKTGRICILTSSAMRKPLSQEQTRCYGIASLVTERWITSSNI